MTFGDFGDLGGSWFSLESLVKNSLIELRFWPALLNLDVSYMVASCERAWPKPSH